MKFTWEISDIRGGVRYTKMDIREIWIIGYKYATNDKVFCSVSLLDGSISQEKTSADMAADLTKSGYIPLEMSDKREREKID